MDVKNKAIAKNTFFWLFELLYPYLSLYIQRV